MRAAVEVRPCKRNGCRNNLPHDAASQARYCTTEDCDRDRYLERKARQYACEENAFTRVVLELEEGPKRRTSEDEGERGTSTHGPPHLSRNDWSKLEDHNSPGELWLRGECEKAMALADKRRQQALVEADTSGGDVGLWDGLGMSSRSPGRRKVVEFPANLLTPDQARCASMMGLEAGTGLARPGKRGLP